MVISLLSVLMVPQFAWVTRVHFSYWSEVGLLSSRRTQRPLLALSRHWYRRRTCPLL